LESKYLIRVFFCLIFCAASACSQGEGKHRFPGKKIKPYGGTQYIQAYRGERNGEIDRWGGYKKIKNPDSKHITGVATDVTSWTLTDVNRRWQKDELKGCILQPDAGKELYFLIESNDSDVIRVYGSSSHYDEDCAYRCVADVSGKGTEYAVLDRWSVRKVNRRWLLFDPYGNAFIIKSVNGYCYENHRYGDDESANSFCENIQLKHNARDCYEALQLEIDTVKKIGFNCWGEIVDLERTVPGGPYFVRGKTSARYQPFIASIRINSLVLKKTNALHMNMTGQIWDSCNSDFQEDIIESLLSERPRARNAGIQCFNNRTGWQAHYLTPYKSMKFNIPANPYYIGLDWDEEPPYCRSESHTEHIGYYIVVSKGTEPRKKNAIQYLVQRYSSIQKLNAAWRSSFRDWKSLLYSSPKTIDDLLSAEPFCRDFGRYKEKNINMKKDLDDIAENFWRIYCKKVHDAIDALTAVHVLNFGPGYHGWIGQFDSGWDGCTSPEYLFRGSVSADGSIPSIDIIGIGDPMHGAHDKNTEIFGVMKHDLIKRYSFHGRPYWHESCWITAEADSGLTYDGVIGSITKNVLYDNNHDFRTVNKWDTAFAALTGLWILPQNSKDSGKRVYYRIHQSGSSNGSLRVDVSHGPGNGWAWNMEPDLSLYATPGDRYLIVTHDALAHIGRRMPGSYNLYIPLTQEERSDVYVRFLDEMIRLRADNGDYIDVGFSHWEFFDYAFRNGTHEMRNWGFETVRGNLYDGREATMRNGEIQDCGDFVRPVSRKLLNIYADIRKIK